MYDWVIIIMPDAVSRLKGPSVICFVFEIAFDDKERQLVDF